MLDIHEIEKRLHEAEEAAFDEHIAIGEAWIADPKNRELQMADMIATEKFMALQEALDVVTQISWNSNETAEQIVERIVKAITTRVEYVAKKTLEPDEAKTA